MKNFYYTDEPLYPREAVQTAAREAARAAEQRHRIHTVHVFRPGLGALESVAVGRIQQVEDGVLLVSLAPEPKPKPRDRVLEHLTHEYNRLMKGSAPGDVRIGVGTAFYTHFLGSMIGLKRFVEIEPPKDKTLVFKAARLVADATLDPWDYVLTVYAPTGVRTRSGWISPALREAK